MPFLFYHYGSELRFGRIKGNRLELAYGIHLFL
jgi:hypothetical protein